MKQKDAWTTPHQPPGEPRGYMPRNPAMGGPNRRLRSRIAAMALATLATSQPHRLFLEAPVTPHARQAGTASPHGGIAPCPSLRVPLRPARKFSGYEHRTPPCEFAVGPFTPKAHRGLLGTITCFYLCSVMITGAGLIGLVPSSLLAIAWLHANLHFESMAI